VQVGMNGKNGPYGHAVNQAATALPGGRVRAWCGRVLYPYEVGRGVRCSTCLTLLAGLGLPGS
jgi:hypothetical protein